jgi:hypothetical protein
LLTFDASPSSFSGWNRWIPQLLVLPFARAFQLIRYVCRSQIGETIGIQVPKVKMITNSKLMPKLVKDGLHMRATIPQDISQESRSGNGFHSISENSKRLGTKIGMKGLTLLTSFFLLSLFLTYSLLCSSPHCASSNPFARINGGGCWYGHLDLHEVSGHPNLEALLRKRENPHLRRREGKVLVSLVQRMGG